MNENETVMNTGSTPSPGRSNPFTPPDDLAEWMDARALLTFVLEAVPAVELPDARKDFVAADGQAFRPPMLLTLLAYCYARGWADADGIEVLIPRDPMLRYITTGDRLTANDLVRFRRARRETIEQILTLVFEKAWQHTRMTAELRFGERSQYLDYSLYRWFENPLAPDFAKLARQRVDQAVLLDSVAKDV